MTKRKSVKIIDNFCDIDTSIRFIYLDRVSYIMNYEQISIKPYKIQTIKY
jgi:hypothetical protein